jgi:hypothetical protein
MRNTLEYKDKEMIKFTFHQSLEYEIPKVGKKTGTPPKTRYEIVDEFIDFQIEVKTERIKILKTYNMEKSQCGFYKGHSTFL